MPYKGIDVSGHQGVINWEAVKPNIDFAIIRIGYGNCYDSQYKRNLDECERLGIPYGVYWFSYALDANDAINEANKCCDTIANYHPTYPICFDYEYDSYEYACKKNRKPNYDILVSIARAFLNRIEERGYYAMNYTNIDFYNRGFKDLVSKYDTWLATWSYTTPPKACGIWQYSSVGRVNGIKGNVDLDTSYKNYPIIISSMNARSDTVKNRLVNEILEGKWGNGEERKQKLTNAGWNYAEIQSLVNKKVIACNNVAHEVIEGKWGNGEDRKIRLEKAGYPYHFVQQLVNAYMEGK